jgi:hypothetical protein
MRLLNVSLARSIWLFPTGDLNPRGKHLHQAIIDGLVTKYRFTRFPQEPRSITDTSEIKLENGVFQPNQRDPLTLVELKLYADGIIADTHSSTDDSDSFLSKAIQWAIEQFELVPLQTLPVRKIYLSELYVHTDASLNHLNSRFDAFLRRLSSEIVGFEPQPFETAGISFSSDQGNLTKPTPFRFERTLNIPFSQNRYYSSAPLQTEKHLHLLDDLEVILLGDPYTE